VFYTWHSEQQKAHHDGERSDHERHLRPEAGADPPGEAAE
jgi:hypothetical protein